MNEAMNMAKTMASKTNAALHLTKEFFNSAINGISLEDAIKMEDRNQALLMGSFNPTIQKWPFI